MRQFYDDRWVDCASFVIIFNLWPGRDEIHPWEATRPVNKSFALKSRAAFCNFTRRPSLWQKTWRGLNGSCCGCFLSRYRLFVSIFRSVGSTGYYFWIQLCVAFSKVIVCDFCCSLIFACDYKNSTSLKLAARWLMFQALTVCGFELVVHCAFICSLSVR